MTLILERLVSVSVTVLSVKVTCMYSFNCTRSKGLRESESVSPLILNIGHKMEVIGLLHLRPLYLRINDLCYGLNMKFYGFERQYEFFGEEKNLLPVSGIEPKIPRLSSS